MGRTIWDDLIDMAIGGFAVVGALSVLNALSKPQPMTNPQPRPYTLADLRAETQAGFELVDSEVQQLRDRVAVLEKENSRLRPFADFLESKQKEREQQNKIPIQKPKPHLWR